MEGSLQNPQKHPKKGGSALAQLLSQGTDSRQHDQPQKTPVLPPNLPAPGSNPGGVGD